MKTTLEWAQWLRQYQQENGLTFEDMLNAFALFAELEGHKVIIDGLEWIPPLIEGSVQ